jgi:hypothetical protein
VGSETIFDLIFVFSRFVRASNRGKDHHGDA